MANRLPDSTTPEPDSTTPEPDSTKQEPDEMLFEDLTRGDFDNDKEFKNYKNEIAWYKNELETNAPYSSDYDLVALFKYNPELQHLTHARRKEMIIRFLLSKMFLDVEHLDTKEKFIQVVLSAIFSDEYIASHGFGEKKNYIKPAVPLQMYFLMSDFSNLLTTSEAIPQVGRVSRFDFLDTAKIIFRRRCYENAVAKNVSRNRAAK